MPQPLRRKHVLLVCALVIVVLIVGLKLGAHKLRREVLSRNPFFSGMVAANVFLMDSS